MKQSIQKLDSVDISALESYHEKFALDILTGLSEPRKSIPSIYHYDTEGSKLFNRITELPEYYPTRCEMETLERNSDRISAYLEAENINLVEFGPGDGQKTRILIESFLKRKLKFQYIPIDISHSALTDLYEAFRKLYPDLFLEGLVADYFSGIKWLNNKYDRKNVILFLGSNIGNFNQERSKLFLRNLWNHLNDGDIVIIGFDLKKDIDILLRAYNDSQGVTADFNLNLLRRINRELAGEFEISNFRFFATYDVFSGAMESYLVSLEKQEVIIGEIGRSFRFDAWEPIHTEYSYKYLESDIQELASKTGFIVKEHLYDQKKYFVDSVWEVSKPHAK
jgi:L-histidine N-alpha-methyltransferase